MALKNVEKKKKEIKGIRGRIAKRKGLPFVEDTKESKRTSSAEKMDEGSPDKKSEHGDGDGDETMSPKPKVGGRKVDGRKKKVKKLKNGEAKAKKSL